MRTKWQDYKVFDGEVFYNSEDTLSFFFAFFFFIFPWNLLGF